MRREIIDYLAALAIADPRQTGIAEAGFFASKGGYNSVNTLVTMFRELGVLWYEAPENVTENWRKRYGSDRPNWYTSPLEYDHARFTGKTRLQFCREAFEFLAKKTKPLSEGRLPHGIEKAIGRLLSWSAAQGHEEKALAAINKQIREDAIQVIKSCGGEFIFEYGILTDSDDPLLAEADVKLRKLEMGLRQLIQQVLCDAYPNGWDTKLGFSDERLKKIQLLMEKNRKKGYLDKEQTILNFINFSDLITIIKQCWSYLEKWIKNKEETIVFLSTLLPLRNDMAHGRQTSREDLMLVIGVATRLCEKVGKGIMLTRHSEGK